MHCNHLVCILTALSIRLFTTVASIYAKLTIILGYTFLKEIFLVCDITKFTRIFEIPYGIKTSFVSLHVIIWQSRNKVDNFNIAKPALWSLTFLMLPNPLYDRMRFFGWTMSLFENAILFFEQWAYLSYRMKYPKKYLIWLVLASPLFL